MNKSELLKLQESLDRLKLSVQDKPESVEIINSIEMQLNEEKLYGLENLIVRSDIIIYSLELDPEPVFKYISPNITKISGWSQEQIKDQYRRIFSSTSEKANNILHSITTGKCPPKVRLDYPLVTSESGEVWVRNQATLEEKDGRRILVGSLMDITINKKLETEKRTAINATRVKSEFLAHMSHEIRTPINSVLGLNSLLQKTNLNEEQNYYAGLIHKSASSLLEIINDILDISKIESGKLQLEKRPFNLKNFLNETLEIMEVQAKQKGLRFETEIHELPGAVKGDSKHLGQIIRNLVNNAIKFTDQGFIRITIKEKFRNADSSVLQFTIEDSGIGIHKDKISSVFNSFTQASDSIAREYGGSGLGLNICKKLIELMDGHIQVESGINQGSMFTFDITLETEGLNHHETIANMNLELTGLDESASDELIKILIVEDNEINQLVLGGLLKKMGNVNLTFASNGKLGIEEFENDSFDFIFMDCQMPVMDGFSATRKIREIENPEKRTPVVAITANAMTSAKEECLKAGMNEYITKPIEEARLREVFNKLTSTQEDVGEKPPVENKANFDSTNLNALGDSEVIRQVVDSYLDTIHEEYEKLVAAAATNKLDDCDFILHSIQGLSGNIGALGVSTTALQVSNLFKNKGLGNPGPHLNGLNMVIERYNDILKSYLTYLN